MSIRVYFVYAYTRIGIRVYAYEHTRIRVCSFAYFAYVLVRLFLSGTVVMARAKRSYILTIKVNMLFSFFSLGCFLKEIENMYSVFLSSYRNTRESLRELEKAVKTQATGKCFHSISRSPKLPLMLL